MIHAAPVLLTILLAAPVRSFAAEPVLPPEVAKRYAVIYDGDAWRARLYRTRDFDAVEAFVAASLKKLDDASSDRLTSLYRDLWEIRPDFAPPEMKAVLDEWIRSRPSSHAALLVRGEYRSELGWKVRGHGWGKDVGEARHRIFREKLALAKADLEAAYALAPEDPNPAALLVNIARDLSLGRAAMEDYYRKALAAYPGHHYARYEKLQFLEPRWFGSLEEVEAFGRECLEDSKKYPYAGRVAIDALDEKQDTEDIAARSAGRKPRTLVAPDENFALISKVYDRILEKNPEDWEIRMRYAHLAVTDGRYPEAAEQFDLIGDRWSTSAHWDGLNYYNANRVFIYKKIALDAYQKRAWSRAAELYRKTLDYSPDDLDAIMRLAYVEQRDGRLDSAKRLSARALLLNPAHDSWEAEMARYIAVSTAPFGRD